MIDDSAIPLAAAASRLPSPRGGKRLHANTLRKWIVVGARALSGETVRLRAVRVGASWFVRPADLDAFVAALNAPAEHSQQAKGARRG